MHRLADRDTLSQCYDSIHNDWYVVAEDGPYLEMVKLYEEDYGLTHSPLEKYINLTFVREALKDLRLFRPPISS